MREMSALYKRLRTAIGSYYEVKVVRGSTVYGMDALKSLEISQALYDGDGPQVGSTYSAECKVTLIEDPENWPRMASFEVLVRLHSANDSEQSEWLSMGTYYTDERKKSKYGDLSITAYDGMLLLERPWTDQIPDAQMPTTWPITGRAVLNLLISYCGIVVDNLSDIDNTVAFVGLDTTNTVRDILSLVAAGNGYNCQMTAAGHIRFVGMAQGGASNIPAIAGVAVAGISVVGVDEADADYGADVGKAYLSTNIMELDFSPMLQAISGVELSTDDGTTATAGTDTGYVLKTDCNFSDSLIAPVCLANLNGLQYAPFEGTTAILDPAAEVGDLVQIGAECYQMVTINWTFGKHITADIGAPYEEEVDHEYTMLSESAKNLRKTLQQQEALETRVYSAIQQTASSITTTVAATYVTQTSFNSEVQDLEDAIAGVVGVYSGGVVPTLNNYPAEDWTTTDDRDAHVGNLYLVTSESASPMAGRYYRFEEDSGTYGWVLVEDAELDTALLNAQSALNAAAELDRDYQEFKTEIQQTVSDVTISISETTDDLDELKMHYRFDENGETIGKSNSEKSVRVANDGIDMMVNQESVVRVNQDEMYAPRKVTVPYGGSFQLGNFMWQPRSSGNMSLLWVGES